MNSHSTAPSTPHFATPIAAPNAPMLLAMQGTPLDQAAASNGAPAPGATLVPGGPAGAAPGGAKAAPPDNTFFFMILGLIVVMFAVTMFSGRRQRRQREAMIGALKKHDRVMTSGGIIGSVVELKPKTVILKVDESSNTRITFARESIQQVLEAAAESAGAEAKA